MLFKEKNIKIEDGFEKRREIFNKIIEDTVSELKKNCQNIGEGKTAEVKIMNERNSICLKIVDNSKIRKNGVHLNNEVNEEIEFLDKLSDKNFLQTIGIEKKIVPKPMFSKQSGNYGFLFLEKIEGITIEDFLKQKSNNKLPENFNWESYFAKLENIITKLNSAKLFHRDLHEGNIFINKEGDPIIIDFGDACETFLSDEDPYHQEKYDGNIISYIPDMQHVKRIKEKILNLI